MKTTTDYTDLKSKLLQAFESQANGEATYIVRTQAIENFERLGWPTTKHEEWKYTNLAATLKNDFELNVASPEAVPNLPFDLEANVLVFVNGVLSSGASEVVESEKELIVLSISEASKQYPDLVNAHFARHTHNETEAATALNTAFAANATFVYVPNNVELKRPIVFYHVTDATQGNILVQPRNLIIIGQNSRAKLVETSLIAGENMVFNNAVSEIIVNKDAVVELVQLQLNSRASICNTTVYQEDKSTFTAVTFTLNGTLTRNNLNLLLNGQYCEGNMYGLYVADGKSHIDNHTVADHRLPNSQSNELYKGILNGRATGVFNGKIFVKPDAQKTNAFQSNRNILLSDDANVYTKPQLEIFADDVKCSHGATIGALDEEPMFYMRARGLSAETARALLLHAFASDILERISIPEIKEYAEEQLTNWL